ncbi:MAG: CDP-diacylglycerol--serine O-phosphatidyltransferase [Myxococcota bacterium]
MSEDVPDSDAKPRRRKHFSMLREYALADLITLANASAGTSAIFLTLRYLATGEHSYMWTAFGLIPLALLFDFLDGAVARWRHKKSRIGPDLDSLSDIVSFGVAPAVLAYALGMQGGIDMAFLVFFVACGISRLARYNVTAEELADESGKVEYYEGTPIPTSIVLVGVMAAAFATGSVGEDLWFGAMEFAGVGWHPLSTMYLVMGCAMISQTLRIPKP